MSDDEPAIGVGVRVSCGRLQFDLTAAVPTREMEFRLDDMLDKLARSAKRQRAIADLPYLRNKRLAELAVLHDQQEKLAAMDETLNDKAERRRAEIAKIKDDQGVCRNEFVVEWTNNSKRGEFRPSSLQRTRLNSFEQQISTIEGAHLNDINEHKVARSRVENEVTNMLRSIEISDRAIADFEAQARGEDTDEAGIVEFEMSGVGETANDV